MSPVLALQALSTLSDGQAAYRLRHRPLFLRFAGPALRDAGPHPQTIGLCASSRSARVRPFARCEATPAERASRPRAGRSSMPPVVEARWPRPRKEEKARLRDGGTPEGCSKARTRQIDRDGRGTIERGREAGPPEGGSRRRAAESAVPMFGYENPLGSGRGHGFVRRCTVARAAQHEGGRLGAGLDPNNRAGGVGALTTRRSAADGGMLDRRGLVPDFLRAEPRGRPMPTHIARGHAPRVRLRGPVAPGFVTENGRTGPVAGGIGPAPANARIPLADPAHTLPRPVWIEGRAGPARPLRAPQRPRRPPPGGGTGDPTRPLPAHRAITETHARPPTGPFEVFPWPLAIAPATRVAQLGRPSTFGRAAGPVRAAGTSAGAPPRQAGKRDFRPPIRAPFPARDRKAPRPRAISNPSPAAREPQARRLLPLPRLRCPTFGAQPEPPSARSSVEIEG